MKSNPFDHELVWQIGPVLITRPVVTTWAVMAVMVAWPGGPRGASQSIDLAAFRRLPSCSSPPCATKCAPP
ncbi:MAG: hypothetical protein R3E42_16605 [Burkholderiaceae bacterium]